MPFDKEKPRKPKTVYVKGHFRSKPKKTDEPKGPNPTIFLMLAKHDSNYRISCFSFLSPLSF